MGLCLKELALHSLLATSVSFCAAHKERTSAPRQRHEAVTVGAWERQVLGPGESLVMVPISYPLASQESRIVESPCSKGQGCFILLWFANLSLWAFFERPPALKIQVSPETPALLPLLFTLKSTWLLDKQLYFLCCYYSRLLTLLCSRSTGFYF